MAGRLWPVLSPALPDMVDVATMSRQAEPVPVEVALHTDPAVVVLGDPGSGKSTLLKVLALALAEQPNGPLPILLPLNAYARYLLHQGELNLCQYLGEYYASHQQKLVRVGELFQHALAAKQAVVLLDGLDEVQANRPHLVRLVQDFVAEYMPQPAEPQSLATVPGNRVVVTSRIVGYDEAPLAGRQWHTYTLTDFTRADIEQFVTQWTLALARSIQGDTEPARRAATQEQHDLLQAIFSRPSVERLAANPLVLTILALIKHTGVVLPEQRVKLYELYLQTLIESWNLARLLDQYPVGEGMRYEETVQVLAPLALWLRQENPTAGLVTQEQLEHWLTEYYHGEEWGLPRGEARQRGRAFLESVQRYSNLLLERGERQYGFLHLTLEEMLAAKGIAQRLDDQLEATMDLVRQYVFDPAWHETLLLAVGFIGVIQQRPRSAGAVLQELLTLEVMAEAEHGRPVIFAAEALLEMGPTNVSRPVSLKIEQALVETMQSATCPIRIRRDAGNLLGRLGWTPELDLREGDVVLAPAGCDPTGLDVFCRVPGMAMWMGKYPVMTRQFARFIEADGYQRREFWSAEGWTWRLGTSDSQAPAWLQDWLKSRPAEKRDRPLWWDDRIWHSPLYPVVRVSWFEAEAYTCWLTDHTRQAENIEGTIEMQEGLRTGQFRVRLPTEAEWEAAMGGDNNYPWGDRFDATRLNCAESWAGQEFADDEAWRKWLDSDTESWREASITAVTTYPQGVSSTGIWDVSGNVWEWLRDSDASGSDTRPLRGGAWNVDARHARVSSRGRLHPADFTNVAGFRVVVVPVL